jgi:hypothetical protein
MIFLHFNISKKPPASNSLLAQSAISMHS